MTSVSERRSLFSPDRQMSTETHTQTDPTTIILARACAEGSQETVYTWNWGLSKITFSHSSFWPKVR